MLQFYCTWCEIPTEKSTWLETAEGGTATGAEGRENIHRVELKVAGVRIGSGRSIGTKARYSSARTVLAEVAFPSYPPCYSTSKVESSSQCSDLNSPL
jgi:hypothetical protein